MYADSAKLAAMCEKAREAGRLGVDCEFIRERTYYPKLALIQLATEDEIALVDPIDSVDLAPLDEIMGDPSVLKVLHAPKQDLEIFYNRTQKPPRAIFDTQLAASFAGLGSQLAYSALVMRVLERTVAKGESFTDWLQRPLSADQERYALEDVRHLFELHDQLSARLEELGRSAWVEEECRGFEEIGIYEQDPSTLYKKVKRAGGLKSRGLAVLRELAIWREEEAKERDKPRRAILSDELLVELARMAPKRVEDLKRFRGLPPRVIQRTGKAIVAAIREGNAVTKEATPERTRGPRMSDGDQLSVDLLDSCHRALCNRASISPQIVGTRADLERLVLEVRLGVVGETRSSLLTGWRRELVGEDLLKVLAGEVSIHLDPETGFPEFVARGEDGTREK